MGASYGGQDCVRLQRKLVCFNSRFYQPGTEAVDAFTQNWEFENNWLHPPVCQVANVISHLRACI